MRFHENDQPLRKRPTDSQNQALLIGLPSFLRNWRHPKPALYERARTAGFSTEQIWILPPLWGDRKRPVREIRQLAAEFLAALELKIAELTSIADALLQLSTARSGRRLRP